MYRVRCPACSATIKIKEKLFGRKVSCRCGHVLRIPNPDGDQTNDDLLYFSCSSCKKKLAAKPESAGKLTRCPCGETNQVPSPVAFIPDEPVMADVIPADDPFLDMFEDVDLAQQTASPDPLASANPGNPYAAPVKTPTYKPKRKSKARNKRADVEQVIRGQKLLIYALLGIICCFLFSIGLGVVIGLIIPVVDMSPEAVDFAMTLVIGAVAIVYLGCLITAVIGVGRMGQVLIGAWWWLLIPFMFVGCLNLVILLVMNSVATGYLRREGVQVGFLGAK